LAQVGTGVPPHARGWTDEQVVLRVERKGSPARAGMDRVSPSSNSF